MDTIPKKTFLRRRYTDGKNLLNYTNYQKNANQNYSEVSHHNLQNSHY